MRHFAVVLALPFTLVATLVLPHVGVFALVVLFYVRPQIWGAPAFLQPVEILTLTAMAALVIHRLRGRVAFRLPAVSVTMLLMVGAAYLSARNASISSGLALERAEVYLKCAVFALLVSHLIDDLRKLDRLAWTIVAGTAWLVKSAVVLAFTAAPDRVDSIGGQGGGANFLALMLVSSAPILLVKLRGGRGWERVLSMGLLPLWALAMALSGSRGGALAMGLVLLLFLWSCRRRALAATLGTVAVLAILFLAPERYLDRMRSISDYRRDRSAADRIELWQAGLRVSEDRPLLGVGPENFRLLSSRHTRARASDGKGLVTHNTYIHTLAEQGVVGLALLLLTMGLTWHALRRTERLAPDTPYGRRLASLALAFRLGLIGFAAHSVFMSNLHRDNLWWWFGIAGASHLILARVRATHAAAEEDAASREERIHVTMDAPPGTELRTRGGRPWARSERTGARSRGVRA